MRFNQIEMTCEKCDELAVEVVQDTKETPSVRGWENYERMGPLHFFCAEHAREPMVRKLKEPS